MRRFLTNYLWPLLAAVIVTTILACIFQTQRVIGMLIDVGGKASMGERLSMTFFDIQHLGIRYGVFIFAAFLVAMTTALFMARKYPNIKQYLYIGAGMVAMVVLLFAMKKAFFDTQMIAGARDWFGILLQAFAGGFGGKVFYRLRQEPKTA